MVSKTFLHGSLDTHHLMWYIGVPKVANYLRFYSKGNV